MKASVELANENFSLISCRHEDLLKMVWLAKICLWQIQQDQGLAERVWMEEWGDLWQEKGCSDPDMGWM